MLSRKAGKLTEKLEEWKERLVPNIKNIKVDSKGY